MKKNNKWFSIIMALWLVIFINLIAISIIDYIIPFSKNTKGIENSIVSYYQAETWIENALYVLKWQVAWTESSTGLTSDAISSAFNITARWNILPPSWDWNSEYDSDWNQIAMWNPIQLEIWKWNIDFNSEDIEVNFKVPDLNWTDNLTNLILSWSTNNLPIINWQLSSQNNTLNATGSYIITADEICDINNSCSVLNLSWFIWIDLNWDEDSIEDFYSAECWIWLWCILKLSVINKLEDDVNNISIPYLEWKMEFDSFVPLRYSIIETEGKAYWYKKNLKVRVPQQTTNEAFDFTVFQ